MIRRLAVARYPMVQDYGFLIRFIVLFALWGSVAYSFRLYIDLTWRGVILAGLFMVASIMVLFGFWTRSAMAALGVIVIAKGWVQHSHIIEANGLLPLISALLPLGALYSVDRWLEVGRLPVPYVPTAPALAARLPMTARVVFVALVAFMVGGPAYNEIFHHHSKLFRSWDMYHVIGKNLVMLNFSRSVGGAREPFDYLEALGHKLHGPGLTPNAHARRDMKIIGTDDLDRLIAKVCKVAPDPASLRIEARIAALKRGWSPLFSGNEVICDASGKPLLKAAALDGRNRKEEASVRIE